MVETLRSHNTLKEIFASRAKSPMSQRKGQTNSTGEQGKSVEREKDEDVVSVKEAQEMNVQEDEKIEYSELDISPVKT